MIRLKQSTSIKPLDELEQFLEEFEDNAYDLFESIAKSTEKNMLDALQVEPPPTKHPIYWTSEKQRLYYFAVVADRDSKGRILPYKRTGKMLSAWEVQINRDKNSFIFITENTSMYSKYVVGSLAQDKASASRFMQGFHQDTGWNLAHDIVYYWMDDLITRFSEEIENVTARRAFTGYIRK